MNVRRWFPLAIVCLLVLPSVALAQAQGFVKFELPLPDGAPPPGAPVMIQGPAMGGAPDTLPLLMSAGDLTEAQRSQVDEIMRRHHESLGTLFEDLGRYNEEMSAKLLSAGAVDDEVLGLVDKIGQARQQLVLAGARVALEVRGVLTPEQLAHAADVRKKLDALELERRKILGDDVVFFAN